MLTALLAVLAAASGAGGHAAPAAAATATGKPLDPNKMICETRQQVGSRLAGIRECHTPQQWEEMRRQERLGMLRKQGNGDHGCNLNAGDPCGVRNGGKDTPW
jgi:hypothetical protein